MKIRRDFVPEDTLENFATRHDLTLHIVERRDRSLPRFYASFDHVEIMDRGLLCSASGNGTTEAEAIADLAAQISTRKIAVRAMKPERAEIDVPRLVAVIGTEDQ